MLCLSDVLSGFLVGGNHLGKICCRISAENRNRKPLPNETMGRGILVSIRVSAEYTWVMIWVVLSKLFTQILPKSIKIPIFAETIIIWRINLHTR